MRAAGVVTCIVVLCWGGPLAAQTRDEEPEDLGPALEYPQGPVVTSNRVIGLGGAYVGIADGAAGHLFNPASFATRYLESRNDLVDWDWTFYTLPIPGNDNPDLYGGPNETENSAYIGGGLDLKIAGFGIGGHLLVQTYQLNVEEEAVATVANVSGGVGVAYAHELLNVIVGAYAYLYAFAVEHRPDGATEDQVSVLSLTGGGTRLGVLWRPEGQPLRIGVTWEPGFRAGSVTVDDPDFFAGPRPRAVNVPGELTLGSSYMFGDRTYNPHHTWGLPRLADEEGPDTGGRRYFLVSYDLVLTAASPDAVSMRGYLRGAEIPAGEKPTLSIRLGTESEILDNWLVLRAGYYFEPPRTSLVRGRHHGTGGFTFRLPFGEYISFWPWDLRLEAAFDFARNYTNAGIGFGFWH